jgi:hypothetical protein
VQPYAREGRRSAASDEILTRAGLGTCCAYPPPTPRRNVLPVRDAGCARGEPSTRFKAGPPFADAACSRPAAGAGRSPFPFRGVSRPTQYGTQAAACPACAPRAAPKSRPHPPWTPATPVPDCAAGSQNNSCPNTTHPPGGLLCARALSPLHYPFIHTCSSRLRLPVLLSARTGFDS